MGIGLAVFQMTVIRRTAIPQTNRSQGRISEHRVSIEAVPDLELLNPDSSSRGQIVSRSERQIHFLILPKRFPSVGTLLDIGTPTRQDLPSGRILS